VKKFVDYLDFFSVVHADVLLFLVPSLYAPRSLKIAIFTIPLLTGAIAYFIYQVI
jgi:hypothetical protein